MKSNLLLLATGACLAATLALFSTAYAQEAPAADAAPAAEADTGPVPVVVELYTSQGCSSCPPADTLLSEIAADSPVDNVQVIPLAFHVDYWNRLGWTDRFSSAEFTQRQQDYSRHFKNDSTYTPQMIVDGRAEFVGRSRPRAEQALQNAARLPKADVQLDVGFQQDTNAITIDVTASNVARPENPRDAVQVFVYITERNLETAVSEGENAGKVLENDAVVRKMQQVGAVTPGKDFREATTIRIEPGWNPRELTVVVVLQERIGRKVMGAAMERAPR